MEYTNSYFAKRIVQIAYPEYKGRKIRLVVTDSVNCCSYWDGGSRDYFESFNLTDKKVVYTAPPQSGFDPTVKGLDNVPITKGFCVIEHSIFCGKDIGMRIHIHPDDKCLFESIPTVSNNVSIDSTDYTITINNEKGGIELRFPAKPDDSVLNKLKSNGWRWTGFNKCWYNYNNEFNMQFAKELMTC